MNYTAHLSSGGTLALTFKNGVDTTQPRGEDTWLCDDNGVMVNMTYVAALVPVTAEEPSRARRFRDADGDVWTQQPNGMYAHRNLFRTWPTVVGAYGPLEEVIEND